MKKEIWKEICKPITFKIMEIRTEPIQAFEEDFLELGGRFNPKTRIVEISPRYACMQD